MARMWIGGLMLTWGLALVAVTSAPACAALHQPPTGTLPTMDSISATPGEHCGYTLYGQTVFSRGVECPDLTAIERETAFLIDLTNATHDTFEGTRVIFTDERFLCGHKWTSGCEWLATIVVTKHAGWRRTLRHELEHRRREILMHLGVPPPEGHGPDWYSSHKPETWWAVVERGAP